jgi:hypothetical protein
MMKSELAKSTGPTTRGGARGARKTPAQVTKAKAASKSTSRKSAAPAKSKRPVSAKKTGFMGKVKASLAAGRKRKAEQNLAGNAMDRAKKRRALR